MAALAPPSRAGAPAILHLIGEEERTVPFDPASLASAIAWSPRGDVLAVVGTTTSLVSGDGRVLASADARAVSDGRMSSLMSGGYLWSPGGEFFAALVNGDLVLLWPEGRTKVVPASQFAGEGQGRFLEVWVTGEGPVIAENGVQWVASVSGDGVTIAPLEGRAVQRPAALDPVPAEIRSRAGDVLPGGTIVWGRLTGDGAAFVAEVRDRAGNGRVVTILTTDANRKAEVVNLDLESTRGGGLFDALVVPGG